uniref:NET domain-containing protein n=1 Tax=Panagrellus redivivus TaxID=6233 RepID=A0A7E5A1C3_PANRE
MTGPEKDALCRNINEFMKSGVDDMIKIIGKYDKELQPMLVNAKSIICYFQMIRTVTLRELEAYMESTPNKRKLKFRQKAIEEHEQSSANSRALSVPPGGKTNAVNQSRAKSVGPTKKQACLCGANHASDEHPLTPLETRYLRGKIDEYGRDGILDMIKIIHKHELHIPVMRPTSEALLQHLEKLRPKTLREIAEYIFATPNKRIAVVVQPENFYIMPEADAPTSPYDYPMDDIIELVETSIPLASDLSKCRPHIVKDATPEEVQTTKLPQKAPETAVDEVFVVQPENFYVMPEADAPTSPYDFPMDDVIESAETSIPLASDSLEEESTPERQFEKPVYEFDLDDVRSFETMTFEQKHALSRKVDKLCAHGKNDLIEIVDKHEGHPGAKERLVDFNQLRSVTLREIEAYFNAMPDDWKSKCEPRKAKASKSKKQMDKTAAGNPGIKKHYLFESSTSDSENPKDASSESNSSHGSDDSCDSSSSESDDESETATVTPALSHAPLLTTHSPAPTTKTVSSTKRARSPWNMDVEVPPFSETYFEDDF